MQNPQTLIKTDQALLRIEERVQVGIKIQRKTGGGFKEVPITRKATCYCTLDTTDQAAVRAAIGSDARVISSVFYNTVTRTQEVCIAGHYEPVAKWIKPPASM